MINVFISDDQSVGLTISQRLDSFETAIPFGYLQTRILDSVSRLVSSVCVGCLHVSSAMHVSRAYYYIRFNTVCG